MPERVGIFIDGPNLFGGVRRLTGDGRLDVPALVLGLAEGRDLVEAVFWTGVLLRTQNPDAFAAQRRFFSHFEQQVPHARVGRAVIRVRDGGRTVEKGVDVGVALDLVVGAFESRWDTGMVVSGDGDLARAGMLTRHMGKRFEVVAVQRSLSELLRAQAERLTILGPREIERLRR